MLAGDSGNCSPKKSHSKSWTRSTCRSGLTISLLVISLLCTICCFQLMATLWNHELQNIISLTFILRSCKLKVMTPFFFSSHNLLWVNLYSYNTMLKIYLGSHNPSNTKKQNDHFLYKLLFLHLIYWSSHTTNPCTAHILLENHPLNITGYFAFQTSILAPCVMLFSHQKYPFLKMV